MNRQHKLTELKLDVSKYYTLSSIEKNLEVKLNAEIQQRLH
jgi:hypothetical protein